jgi:HAMP domain-containing protein
MFAQSGALDAPRRVTRALSSLSRLRSAIALGDLGRANVRQ